MFVLTDQNYIQFALQHYDSPFFEQDEFNEDLKRVVYVKRLLNSYTECGVLKERLLLNHIVVLYNMFGNNATTMLFLKLKGHESALKTVLSYLNKMPRTVGPLGSPAKLLYDTQIPLDPVIWQKLQLV